MVAIVQKVGKEQVDVHDVEVVKNTWEPTKRGSRLEDPCVKPLPCALSEPYPFLLL